MLVHGDLYDVDRVTPTPLQFLPRRQRPHLVLIHHRGAPDVTAFQEAYASSREVSGCTVHTSVVITSLALGSARIFSPR
jgi:hypothetical protein